MTNPNLSAKEAANAYAKAKSAKKREEILAYVKARAEASKRVRWQRLLDDITNGDKTRINARATGDWSAVKRDEPKADAKPKAATKAKAKPAANTPASPDDLVAAFAGMSDDQLVAFFNAVQAARG